MISEQLHLLRAKIKLKLPPLTSSPDATADSLAPAGIANAPGDRFRIFQLAIAATTPARHNNSLMITAEPMPQQ